MDNKTIIFLFILIILSECQEMSKGFSASNPEIFMNTSEMVKSYGYPFENHRILTEDGYFISLHRIPYGLSNITIKNRPVVFLQHGLLDSSFTWVNNGPEKSLAFILADNGFDVWLGNSRGNIYSKGHIRLSSTSRAYWEFSWDEMSKYDLPTSVEYVLETTKAMKISYIGHSQGTAIAFAKLSQYSELNERISSLVALAPVAYLGHVKSGIRYLAYVAGGIDLFYNVFTHGEFLPTNTFTSLLAKYVCGDDAASMLCSNIVFLLAGYSTYNLDYSRLPIYLSHTPAGTSSKNMVHFAQCYKSDEFKMYDHGMLGNLYYYHRINPPKYEVTTNGVPVALFWGGNDWLAVPKDVLRTSNELGNDVKLRKFIRDYNHMDFIWGKDASEVIYKDIIEFLNKYQ